ncbi:hypothetical protein V3C99_006665 [Haemonchus contortus]
MGKKSKSKSKRPPGKKDKKSGRTSQTKSQQSGPKKRKNQGKVKPASSLVDSKSPSNSPPTTPGGSIGDTVVIDGVKYKKKRILGTGGSGSVFEIIREDNGTSFALKETSLRQNAEIYRGEVERLQTLKNCPHIIDLIAHDIIANNTILRMVLELGDGDLESEVKKNKGTLDAATVRLYAYEIGKGIQEMHENSIIHLDIKLANVLIISGTLKLVDFGLSATLRKNEDHVIRDFMFGSNRPPEQIVPRKDGTYKLTKKVDIWGFGFIVYQMTYGRKPFSNYTNKNMLAILDPNIRLQHDIHADPAITEFFEKCIQRDVDKRATIEQLFAHRYLSEAEAIMQDKLAAQTTMTTTMTTTGTSSTAPKKNGRGRRGTGHGVTTTQETVDK